MWQCSFTGRSVLQQEPERTKESIQDADKKHCYTPSGGKKGPMKDFIDLETRLTLCVTRSVCISYRLELPFRRTHGLLFSFFSWLQLGSVCLPACLLNLSAVPYISTTHDPASLHYTSLKIPIPVENKLPPQTHTPPL